MSEPALKVISVYNTVELFHFQAFIFESLGQINVIGENRRNSYEELEHEEYWNRIEI